MPDKYVEQRCQKDTNTSLGLSDLLAYHIYLVHRFAQLDPQQYISIFLLIVSFV